MRWIVKLAIFTFALAIAIGAAAADEASGEAGKHFQRGVDLYTEGDYRGALVEFKKAYTLVPRASVLYDIGEASYQLQDYAAALKSFERFLAETGPNANHRAEVEYTVEVLRARIGRIVLSTNGRGCEVSIDDQSVGVTPLFDPLPVSIGMRRIAVNCPARPVEVRRVEVATGDTVRVDVHFGAPPAPSVLPSFAIPAAAPRDPTSARKPLLAAWISSALLAAAAIGTGTSALVESSELGALKRQFPVQHATLDQKATLDTGLSITTDVLIAATVAVVAISTYYTVKYRREKSFPRKLVFSGTSLGGAF